MHKKRGLWIEPHGTRHLEMRGGWDSVTQAKKEQLVRWKEKPESLWDHRSQENTVVKGRMGSNEVKQEQTWPLVHRTNGTHW